MQFPFRGDCRTQQTMGGAESGLDTELEIAFKIGRLLDEGSHAAKLFKTTSEPLLWTLQLEFF